MRPALMHLSSFGSSIIPEASRERRSMDVTTDPLSFALSFLIELVRGAFKPERLEWDLPGGPVLTLGAGWDERFLALRYVPIDDQVVRSVMRRMSRYHGRAIRRFELRRLTPAPLAELTDVGDSPLVIYEIVCDGQPDGTIALRRGDRRIWGARAGWRVWHLSP